MHFGLILGIYLCCIIIFYLLDDFYHVLFVLLSSLIFAVFGLFVSFYFVISTCFTRWVMLVNIDLYVISVYVFCFDV